MLRITEVGSKGDEVILALEGKITGEYAEELNRVCQKLFVVNENVRLKLDLANVSFIDAKGLAILNAWKGRNARVINGSTFLKQLLK